MGSRWGNRWLSQSCSWSIQRYIWYRSPEIQCSTAATHSICILPPTSICCLPTSFFHYLEYRSHSICITATRHGSSWATHTAISREWCSYALQFLPTFLKRSSFCWCRRLSTSFIRSPSFSMWSHVRGTDFQSSMHEPDFSNPVSQSGRETGHQAYFSQPSSP